jgi:hypothetical protein
MLRHRLVIVSDPEHHFLGFFIGHCISDSARFFGSLAPMLWIINGDFGPDAFS